MKYIFAIGGLALIFSSLALAASNHLTADNVFGFASLGGIMLCAALGIHIGAA